MRYRKCSTECKRNEVVETEKTCWFANCRRPFVSDGMKSDSFRLPLKIKCKQVVCRSVHQNCSNAAVRFQLVSISYWSSAFSSVVKTILGGALRLL